MSGHFSCKRRREVCHNRNEYQNSVEIWENQNPCYKKKLDADHNWYIQEGKKENGEKNG